MCPQPNQTSLLDTASHLGGAGEVRDGDAVKDSALALLHSEVVVHRAAVGELGGRVESERYVLTRADGLQRLCARGASSE